MIGRNMRQGTMMVDDVEFQPVESPGRSRSINGEPPYSFGGLRSEAHEGAKKNLAVSSFCFILLCPSLSVLRLRNLFSAYL